MRYERVALEMEVVFLKDGSLMPKTVHFNDMRYEISSITKVRRYYPAYVGCIAPIEYTVLIDGCEKRLYYEADSNRWFSIRGYASQERRTRGRDKQGKDHSSQRS